MTQVDTLLRELHADPEDHGVRERYLAALRRVNTGPHFAVFHALLGNLEATQAVLDHIQQRGIKDSVCLGQLVWLGPNPVEVVDLIRERSCHCLLGAYEDCLIDGAHGWGDAQARDVFHWSREQLRPGFFSWGAKRERWRFLMELPQQLKLSGCEFSARSETIAEWHSDSNSVERRAADLWLRFFPLARHSVKFRKLNPHFPESLGGPATEIWPLDSSRRYLLFAEFMGVPSKTHEGKPGLNATAVYLELIGETLVRHEVRYDLNPTLEKIKRARGLNASLKSYALNKLLNWNGRE